MGEASPGSLGRTERSVTEGMVTQRPRHCHAGTGTGRGGDLGKMVEKQSHPGLPGPPPHHREVPISADLCSLKTVEQRVLD